MRRFFAFIFAILMVCFGFYSSGPTTDKEQHQILVGYILKTHRPIKIFLDESIPPRHVDLIKQTLNRFIVFDDMRVEITDSRELADIVAYKRNNLSIDGVIGLHPQYSNEIYLDIENIVTDLQFQAVFMHEVSHWIGLQHVCFLKERKECSPVGIGFAIMNPVTDDHPQMFFTQLDILEFKRVKNLLFK